MKEHTYTVKTFNSSDKFNINVTVPGSKSITNRALLMASMADGKSRLKGVLFSDDSRHFLNCLEQLGFDIEIDEVNKIVTVVGCGGKIPKEEANIFVGNAGTAARFLTAMLGLSQGKYYIDAAEQMRKRPMKPLMDALEELGASIEYEGRDVLPVTIGNNSTGHKKVNLDISSSTQFLSALLMTAPLCKEGIKIHITSLKKAGSYIKITMEMMDEFGINVGFDGNDYVVDKGACYKTMDYQIEPDASAADYFYAMAALTGGSTVVNNVHFSSVQGDIKFLDVLENMGCQVTDSEQGIIVKGPKRGTLKGVDVDMNDFSDQTMTLAALAIFADSPTTIRNIGHIRLQESDRLSAIATELKRMGIQCVEGSDFIKIYPGVPQSATINTYNDHRMAMAFSIIGLVTEGIVIDNPGCCAKTFENYFEILDSLY